MRTILKPADRIYRHQKISRIHFITGKRYLSQAELSLHVQNMYIGVNSSFDNVTETGINCARNCTQYPDPRICYYPFHAEQYNVMGQ